MQNEHARRDNNYDVNRRNNINRNEMSTKLIAMWDYSSLIPELSSFIRNKVKLFDKELLQSTDYCAVRMHKAFEYLETCDDLFTYVLQTPEGSRREHALNVVKLRLQIFNK